MYKDNSALTFHLDRAISRSHLEKAWPKQRYMYVAYAKMILARLFSKKTSRYCHSPGVVGGGVVGGGVVQKLVTFPYISVITEDIYLKLRVWFTIKRGTHTSRGGNPPIFWTKLCPFFD